MSETTLLSTINLASLEGGKITLTDMKHPYGANSHDVVSIGVSLKGDEPTWQVHIPYENIDELVEALKAAKNSK